MKINTNGFLTRKPLGTMDGPEDTHLGEMLDRFVCREPSAQQDASLDGASTVQWKPDGLWVKRDGASSESLVLDRPMLPTVAITENGLTLIVQNRLPDDEYQVLTYPSFELGAPPKRLFVLDKPCAALDISNDESNVSLAFGNRVDSWALQPMEPQRVASVELDHPIEQMRYLLDGSLALRGTDRGGQARYYFVEPPSKWNPRPQTFEVSFHDNGNLLACLHRPDSGAKRTPLRFWDIQSGRELDEAAQAKRPEAEWMAALVRQRVLQPAPPQVDPNAKISSSDDGTYIQVGKVRVPRRTAL